MLPLIVIQHAPGHSARCLTMVFRKMLELESCNNQSITKIMIYFSWFYLVSSQSVLLTLVEVSNVDSHPLDYVYF